MPRPKGHATKIAMKLLGNSLDNKVNNSQVNNSQVNNSQVNEEQVNNSQDEMWSRLGEDRRNDVRSSNRGTY